MIDYNAFSEKLHRSYVPASVECVKLLLAGGANTGSRDNGGWMPLYYLMSSRQTQTQTQNHEIARLLVEYGADIEARNYDNQTPL
jgi:ankyrin repeat protein